jgi:hypothetical protein
MASFHLPSGFGMSLIRPDRRDETPRLNVDRMLGMSLKAVPQPC